ncbi:UNVERIFIED_CONTAM: hypothetical protein H355_015185 [Colinus virginianus]|nr:hypothetical protein H355_015185 [Colinus virginianus]
MNGARDAAEPAAVWERPWSLEEIRKGSQSWSLASDAGLLRFLQEFSQQTISRTHEIKKQLDGLISETKAADCRLHNVFNDFLMLSNTQFIENRVYDEEVEEPIPKTDVGDKAEQEKTREQKEADLIPKIQEAVNYGLQVLDSAFEQLDIKAGNSDSEEEESNERVELILEPKDLYIDRPLPYLIGSQQFMEQDDVGLGDLTSEEGSVDSDRGSVLDSEEKDEEESDDEFGNPSEDDQKMRTVQMSDEDDYEGCDLFDSEKEDDEDGDFEETTRPGDLFAEAPKEDSKEPDEQVPVNTGGSDVFSSSVIVEKDKKSAAQSSEKAPKQPGKVVLFDDDDDDFFIETTKKPPVVSLWFFSIHSIFVLFLNAVKSAADLFDDDDEGDLFKEKPAFPPVAAGTAKEAESEKDATIAKKDLFSSSNTMTSKATSLPTSKSTTKAPLSLFDDDEECYYVYFSCLVQTINHYSCLSWFLDDDEDIFKPPKLTDEDFTAFGSKGGLFSGGTGLFDDDESQPSSGDDFKPSSEMPQRKQRGLFSDEEDSEDLFSSSNTMTSKATSLPTSKSTTKAPLSLFDDDEEDLFGVVPAKKQQEEPVKEKAKQSESHKKASSLLFSSDEEEHWNVSKPLKPPSEDNQKEHPAKSSSTISQAKAVKKTSLFEEDDEEDLFAITKESMFFQYTKQFGVNDIIIILQEKTKPEQAPPLFNEEEKKEKDDRLDIAKSNETENTLWSSEEPEAVPVPRGADVERQEAKEKPSEKSIRPKSTGVFQDEELLFSNRLQKDNDPDVDLFASPKMSMSANRILKPSSGGSLFGDDDEDDLFSTAKTSPPKIAEKKTVKTSPVPSSGNCNLLENALGAKQGEALKTVTTEASTGSLCLKQHAQEKVNLAINPAALLPGAMPKISSVKSPFPILDAPLHEPNDVQNNEAFPAAGSNEELGVSFDQPMQADTLHSANKTRVKVTGKRRPPSRMARRLAAQESGESEEVDSAKEPQFSVPKQRSAVENVKELVVSEAESKENGFPSGLSLPAHGSILTNKLPPESTDKGDDLFESEDLFASPLASRTAVQSKLREEMADSGANEPVKGTEKKPDLSVLGNQDSSDLFQSVQKKSPSKSSPISFLEEEEDSLFTSQKAGKKELKSAVRQAVDSAAQDIFEDDIFATEAIKPMSKAKEKMPETNLFDDNIDIFADLTVKPKEKKTKKKVEQKSIFDDDMDDIFSGSQMKIPTPKSRSSQAASEAKSESKALSTFDDPLNAFGGQ